MESLTTSLGPDAPPAAQKVYSGSLYAAIQSGKNNAEAVVIATKKLAHAGFYQTQKGWRQLREDIRDRVNLRKAVPQVDGTFAVEDVDVFYPNNTKGTNRETTFTVPDIRRAMKNTNAAINSGGQPPSLTKEHPSIYAKASGVPSHANGHAINFRESPRGKGWARCDFVGIPSSLIKEWKEGKYTGLSAGLVHAADSKDLRFGHVALLGGEPQALTNLPMTEIFSTNEATLCFSTDPTLFQGITDMPVKKPTTLELLTANAANFTAQLELLKDGEGDPEALTTSYTEMTTSLSDFSGAECDKDDDKKVIKDMMDKTEYMDDDDKGKDMMEDEDDEDFMQTAAPSKTTELPTPTELPTSSNEGGGPAEGVDVPEGSNHSAAPTAEFTAMKVQLADNAKFIAALQGRELRTQFSAKIDDLIGQGHAIDPKAAGTMFSAMAASPGTINAFMTYLTSTPKTKVPLAEMGSTFGAGIEAGRTDFAVGSPVALDAAAEAAMLASLNAKMPGSDFTAEDIALGFALTNIQQPTA